MLCHDTIFLTVLSTLPALALAAGPTEPASAEPVVNLSSVVVTGTRTERLLSEAPVRTEILLAEDFDNYNVTCFRDALKLIPAARFENDCQNCGLNQIQLLGLSTEYTSVLFDGAPLYSGLAKVYGADLFPAIFIDRIEVVKGGSSVLYGPEAIAGVVNLITAAPEKSGLSTTMSGESVLGKAGEWEASFIGDYAKPGDPWRFSVYGLYQDRQELDLTTDGFSEIPRFDQWVAGGQTWWQPWAGTRLKANYQYMDQSHRGGDRLDLPEERARVAESLAHRIQFGQIQWIQEVSEDFDFSLQTSIMDIERKSYYGARGDLEQRAFEAAGFTGDVTEDFVAGHQPEIDALARSVWGLTKNRIYYLDSQFNYQLESHTVSLGAQYRQENLSDRSLYGATGRLATQDSFSNVGLFLQDQWAVTSSLEFVPGLRVDDHANVEKAILSPRLAARLQASSALTLRTSWSAGFNAPGAFNEDKHIGVSNGGAIFLVNAPDLREESSQTFSVGAEYQPAVLDRQFIVHSQIHYTTLEDTFEIDDSGTASGDPNLWLRINGASASVWVWENNVNWRPLTGLRLDAGFSFIRARLDEEVARVTGLVTDRFLERPEWTGHVGISWDHPGWFEAGALLSYTGTMLAAGEDADIWRETDPFHVLDLSLSKEFGGWPGSGPWRLSAGVENVFDQRQKDLQNNGEERDPTYLYGPVQPRTYYVRLSMPW